MKGSSSISIVASYHCSKQTSSSCDKGSVCVCVCVCVCVRARARETEGGKREREKETQREIGF